MFQTTITGVGNISVYSNYMLIGALEQNTLVEEYHDVLWSGPVHDLLVSHLHSSHLAERPLRWPSPRSVASSRASSLMGGSTPICRTLMNIDAIATAEGC